MLPINTDPSGSEAHSAPALETGQRGFVAGFLYTTRDAIVSPRRFYTQLGEGSLALPLTFAVISLAIPLLSADIGAALSVRASKEPSFTAMAIIRSLVAPLLAVVVVAIQAVLWTAVTSALGKKRPLDLALRAMAYLTSVASTFGLVMTVSGFAPESAPYVITWYASLASAYLFTTYATYRLAQGAYHFSPVKAALAVWLFQTSCTLTLIAIVATYVAAGGALPK